MDCVDQSRTVFSNPLNIHRTTDNIARGTDEFLHAPSLPNSGGKKRETRGIIIKQRLLMQLFHEHFSDPSLSNLVVKTLRLFQPMLLKSEDYEAWVQDIIGQVIKIIKRNNETEILYMAL